MFKTFLNQTSKKKNIEYTYIMTLFFQEDCENIYIFKYFKYVFYLYPKQY